MRRRKPDLLAVLAVLIGMGVLITGWAQGNMGEQQPSARVQMNR